LIFLAFMFNNMFLQAESFDAYWAQASGVIVKDFVTAAILAIIVVVVASPPAGWRCRSILGRPSPKIGP
ncbi:hypothetical protein, partial [Candidatus Competibacter phosphatis]|uniref:hypothetical protein n=1 Tax=Candidatus Competibacter phosphatis TaxID=221280 RepID=UPI001FE71E28